MNEQYIVDKQTLLQFDITLAIDTPQATSMFVLLKTAII